MNETPSDSIILSQLSGRLQANSFTCGLSILSHLKEFVGGLEPLKEYFCKEVRASWEFNSFRSYYIQGDSQYMPQTLKTDS